MARATDFSTLEDNLYALLDIPPEASAKQIRDGWRRQVKRWHSDTAIDHTNPLLNEQMIRKVNAAYDILKKQRADYDEYLRRRQQQAFTATYPGFGQDTRSGKAPFEAWDFNRRAAEPKRRRASGAGWSANDIEDICIILLVGAFLIILIMH